MNNKDTFLYWFRQAIRHYESQNRHVADELGQLVVGPITFFSRCPYTDIPEGKARSKMNALKHGERTAEAMTARREIGSLLRALG